MKCLKNTLKIEVEVWDDPGDYPNAVAASALKSHASLESTGELILLGEDGDDSIEDFIEYFSDWIACGHQAMSIGADVYVPSYWNVNWLFNVEANKITVTVGEDSKQSLEQVLITI